MNRIQNNTENITSAMIQKDSHLPSAPCCFSAKAILSWKEVTRGMVFRWQIYGTFLDRMRFQVHNMILRGPFQHELLYEPVIFKWEEAEKYWDNDMCMGYCPAEVLYTCVLFCLTMYVRGERWKTMNFKKKKPNPKKYQFTQLAKILPDP